MFLQDQGEAIAHTMTAQRSNARIEGLKAGTPYVVQVRARTVAGYGRYSSPAEFSTNLQSTLLPTLQRDILRYLWLSSSNTSIIVQCISL